MKNATKTFTVDQFTSFISSGNFSRHQEIEQLDTNLVEVPDRDGELVEIFEVFGIASVYHEKDGVTVGYSEGWNHDYCMPDTFTTGTDGMDRIWALDGAIVVDEDGIEVDIHELSYLLTEHDFEVVEYEELRNEIEQTEDIDMDDSKLETFELDNDNAPNIRFKGEKIAWASSKTPDRNDRWTELTLYKTGKGKFVCEQVGYSCWVGERDRHKVEVHEEESDVIEFFGYGWLAKEVYDEAGINAAVEIE